MTRSPFPAQHPDQPAGRPAQRPSRAQRRRARADRWRRETVELAAVFIAVATADLIANVVVHGHDGPVLLAASAVALLGTAVFHSWWAHRHPEGPPGPDPLAGPEPAAVGPAGPLPEQTRLWRLRATVSDAPGSLAAVSTALAELRISIISLQTHPLPDATVDEFLLRAPRSLPRPALTEAVALAGGREIWTEPADAHDLVDVPTHVLALATRTALDAAELPVALRQLFGQVTIRQFPARGEDQRPAPSLAGPVMLLPAPGGELIELSRPHLPFTPTEFARAKALVELDTVLGPRVPKVEDHLRLPGGGPHGEELTVRRARSDDRAAALAMHRRCSPATLRRRYHGPVADADRYLGHLLDPRHGQTLTVETADGRLVALAHLMWDGDSAELAVLVEDAWQRRGLGLDLLRRMAALAAEAGVATVYAVTQAGNTALISAMRRLELPLDYQVTDGTLVITAHLAGAAEQLPSPWPSVPGGR
ncbi:RimJ/RimL family protein N-acetyltransferase [Kitasatospora sp. GAS204A]|uniref:GNAT family N-acetyltransferase n=1 Tax=unclassified Kitasatospora TaxID=2633591 RepID=UPI002475A40D|nr:GNAT family N-acetyltransferase [Kitasatospora sp. GAS204B]MDH6117769.1 RimJ/RimL family protein N-acetyltransferase [Kitasatospora sp. GAS204B]